MRRVARHRRSGIPTQVVEQARETLAARKLAVERGERARMAFLGSSTQVRSTWANRSAKPCARTMPLGPDAPMPAAVSIHCCERTASAVECQRQPRIDCAPSGSANASPPCADRAARAGASARRTAARAGTPHPCRGRSRPAPCGRVSLTWAARIASGEENSRAQLRERHAGAGCDVGESDLFEPLLRQQCHEGLQDALARRTGGAARAAAMSGLSNGSLCGP